MNYEAQPPPFFCVFLLNFPFCFSQQLNLFDTLFTSLCRRILQVPWLLMRFAIHKSHNLLSQRQRQWQDSALWQINLRPRGAVENKLSFQGHAFCAKVEANFLWKFFLLFNFNLIFHTVYRCSHAECWNVPLPCEAKAKYFSTALQHFLAKYLSWLLLVGSAW